MRRILQAAAATTAVMMALGGGAAVRAEPVAPTFDDTAQYTAELNYQDDADGKDPVAGAHFSYYKVGWYDMDNTDGSISSNLVSVVPGTDIPSLIGGGKEEQETQVRNLAKEVQDAYQGQTPTHGKEFDVTTDSNGTALTQGMPQGVYLAVETEAAPLHFASAPFLFSLPYMTGGSGWADSITLNPKPLAAGELSVTKVVEGAAGEKDRDFQFKLSFDSDDAYGYSTTDGRTGTVSNGSTITLKDGQTATVTMIPVGTEYKVEEVEADRDGYKTTPTHNEGVIRRTVKQECTFVNRRDAVPTPTPAASTPSNPSAPGSPSSPGRSLTNTQTGDVMQPVLFGALAAGAAALIVILTAKRKKRNRS